jgi:hypothetical protein
MAESLQINTIDSYFSKIYSEGELVEFKKKLSDKLLSYKFPSEICLSSSYQDTSTLLGTLTFEELDINDYPTYSGDVEKSTEGSFLIITYSTILIFGGRSWQFTLTDKKSGETIIIRSERTTSLDPTKVNYSGISTPTAGACRR